MGPRRRSSSRDANTFRTDATFVLRSLVQIRSYYSTSPGPLLQQPGSRQLPVPFGVASTCPTSMTPTRTRRLFVRTLRELNASPQFWFSDGKSVVSRGVRERRRVISCVSVNSVIRGFPSSPLFFSRSVVFDDPYLEMTTKRRGLDVICGLKIMNDLQSATIYKLEL